MDKNNKQKPDNLRPQPVLKTKINLLRPKIITLTLLLLAVPLIILASQQNSEIRQRAQVPTVQPSSIMPSPTSSVNQIYLISPEITRPPRPHVD